MVVTSPLKPPPARDFPSMNALHGVRLHFDSTPVYHAGADAAYAPSSLLKLNVPVVFGTVPKNAFMVGGTVHVSKVTAGAATLDIGTKAAPTRFLAALPLNALFRDDDLIATAAGWIGDVDTPLYATLKASSDLSGGIFSFLLYYYAKGD
jgi:hypothetical protein